MKLVTAIYAAALVLAPAVGLAQEPGNGAGGTQDQPGLKSKVEHLIGTITGSDTKETKDTKDTKDTKESADAKSGDRDSAPKAAGNTNYPDFAKVKKTDK